MRLLNRILRGVGTNLIVSNAENAKATGFLLFLVSAGSASSAVKYFQTLRKASIGSVDAALLAGSADAIRAIIIMISTPTV